MSKNLYYVLVQRYTNKDQILGNGPFKMKRGAFYNFKAAKKAGKEEAALVEKRSLVWIMSLKHLSQHNPKKP